MLIVEDSGENHRPKVGSLIGLYIAQKSQSH